VRTIRTTLLAHLETMRPYTTLYVVVVAAAGALLVDPTPSVLRLLAAVAAPWLGWTAGLYGGDYFDRRLDAIAKPQRPIPSGRLGARTALGCMVGLVAVGLALSAWLGWRNLVVALAVLGLEVAYSKVFKARGLLGHLSRGLPMSLTLVFGALALGQAGSKLVALSAAFLLHDAFTNMFGALRDVEGDRAGGYLTFPARHGVAATVRLGGAFFGCAVGLVASAAALLGPPHPLAGLAVLAVATVAGAGVVSTIWRHRTALTQERALWAHKVLVLERLWFGGALVTMAVGSLAGAAALVPALAITWLSQRRLRDRHELDAQRSGPRIPPEPAPRRDVLPRLREVVEGLDAAGRRLLAGWERRLRIRIEDSQVEELLLTQGDGSLVRVERDAYAASSSPEVSVETDSATFAEVFVDGTLGPVDAYRSGRVRLRCAVRDMPRLYQVLKALRGSPSLPRSPVTAARPAPRPEPDEPLRHPVVLSDTTLRDGEQAPGVAFGTAQKVAIASMLDRLGVPLIEAGFPAVSAEEQRAIEEVVKLRLHAAVQVIARPVERDLDAALRTGAASIAVFIGTSDSHVTRKLRTTRSRVVEDVARAIAHVKAGGVQVVFAPEDATRTDPAFLLEIVRVAVEAGADAIGVPDTAGVATPRSMAALVETLVRAVPVPIAVHCHDDLGLATANTLAGLQAGAVGAQCSLLGIGERAGNASLEEVAVILETVHGCSTGLDLAQLTPCAAELARVLGWPLPPLKAVVGANAFVHESGLHTDGVIRDPSTYEPFAPDRVGQRRRFVFGKHSGVAAIRSVLEASGLRGDEAMCRRLLERAKSEGEAGRPLDESGLLQLATALGATPPRPPSRAGDT
jgi:isopropylmalate/homocitrate/citramalate synthase/4-hydroxybenzoate polyprenyltransferase